MLSLFHFGNSSHLCVVNSTCIQLLVRGGVVRGSGVVLWEAVCQLEEAKPELSINTDAKEYLLEC